jgi:putative DNA primase/helicase
MTASARAKKVVGDIAGATADFAATERPTIQLGDLAVDASLGEQALLDAGVEIYQHAGDLVRPIVELAPASHGHTTKIARLRKLDTTYLRDLLSRHAIWHSFSAREKKWMKKDAAPKEIAETILARVGEWKFPAISGVITTPTMRPDGSLLTKPGYDPVTRLLLVGPPAMPPIPDKPSREDALRALALLEDLLSEFPFADEVSMAVALSSLLTPVVRGAFPVAPLHACSAPMAGSGKSYLGDVAASIAIGQLMPVMAAGRKEEETEKRLGAALMAGQPLISIDNVTGGLGGDALCVAIERSSVGMRILGKSEQVRIEARGTTFYASGNNIVIVGDVCRRVVTTTLNPGLERPELREFKTNPVAKVMSNRGTYIAAALTICRAYIAAGRPQTAKRLASFEGWSDTVRSALLWLGKADPVASMEAAREQDPERNELLAMLEAWADAIGVGSQNRCALADVIKLAEKTMPGSSFPEHPELYEAVQTVAGRKQKADAGSLGRWMQRRIETVVARKRFVVSVKGKGGSQWWIETND